MAVLRQFHRLMPGIDREGFVSFRLLFVFLRHDISQAQPSIGRTAASTKFRGSHTGFRSAAPAFCHPHGRRVGAAAFRAFSHDRSRLSKCSLGQRGGFDGGRCCTPLRQRFVFPTGGRTPRHRRIQSLAHHHFARGFHTNPKLQQRAARRLFDCEQRTAPFLLPHGLFAPLRHVSATHTALSRSVNPLCMLAEEIICRKICRSERNIVHLTHLLQHQILIL